MRLFSDPPAEPQAAPATLETHPGPMPAYRALRAAGTLKADPMQELAVEKLQILHRALLNYQPATPAPVSFWRAKLGLAGPAPRETRPKGLYIFGGVGRGKSMLMDLFFATSPVRARRRVHFHAFMQEVHDRLHRLRTSSSNGDPIAILAQQLAAGAWLLCFDEFQVTDIADAMILGRLFEAMMALGVVVIATSNREPDDLYRDGLQRERFLPFIAMIKAELDVLELDNGRDYRLSRLMGHKTYHWPDDAAAEAQLAAIFGELTDHVRAEPLILEVKKRALTVPRQAMGVAWFTFAELCAQPLGPGDYLALANQFETILISGVPQLSPTRRDEAKRFNTLIDTLYEAKVHLVLSAAVPPDDLYLAGDGAFEFARTVSRLMEMQSSEYMAWRRPASAKAMSVPGTDHD